MFRLNWQHLAQLLQQNYFRVAHADNIIRAELNKRASSALPSRQELLKGLQHEEFDVLVIGGGATGKDVILTCSPDRSRCWGCSRFDNQRFEGGLLYRCFLIGWALLKTALVELDDYSSGTSSRSTKLIHGGVRYLQAAIMGIFHVLNPIDILSLFYGIQPRAKRI